MIDVQFPKLQEFPRELPSLMLQAPAWDAESMAGLAERLGVRADGRDLGLWWVFDDEQTVVEIFGGSDSFRVARRHQDEREGAVESEVDHTMVEQVARSWAELHSPEAATLQLRSIADHEVLVSTDAGSEPLRFVTGTQANFTFEVAGVPLVGPGAKLAVTVTPDGEVDGAYRFWRNHREGPPTQLLGEDEVLNRFRESWLLQGLDGGARVDVESARVGYLCIPPTETQRVAAPVVEFRGVLATEVNPHYEFVLYANLVAEQPMERLRDRVVDAVPTLITI